MTTQTAQRTEAIEQLHRMLETMDPTDAPNPGVLAARLDHAIRYERRAMADQIRSALAEVDPDKKGSAILRILDEVAP